METPPDSCLQDYSQPRRYSLLNCHDQPHLIPPQVIAMLLVGVDCSLGLVLLIQNRAQPWESSEQLLPVVPEL